MSNYVQHFLDKIFEISVDPSSYESEHNASYMGFLTIGTIIEYSSTVNNQSIDEFYRTKIQKCLEISITSNDFKSVQMKNDFQDWISSIVSSCIISKKILIDYDNFIRIYTTIVGIFNERKDLYANGIFVISALITSKFFT